jgi:hypothetical protein
MQEVEDAVGLLGEHFAAEYSYPVEPCLGGFVDRVVLAWQDRERSVRRHYGSSPPAKILA